PYFCPTCDKEYRERLLTASLAPNLAEAPPAICESCGEPLEFDDLPEYFQFLKDHARPADPVVVASIDKFNSAQLAGKVAALKEISDSGKTGSKPGQLVGATPKPRGVSGPALPAVGTPNPQPQQVALPKKR